ncbi:Ig-like domain-containing protein [Photobacterium damselae]|uniref:Ig-like domain-containing protein n=1 Tax=Photobacterium damselae TaxID=38293 RepID=UPI003D7DDC1C
MGCNGSSSSSGDIEPSPSIKEISINAQSSLSFGQTKSTEIVDLRQRVNSENNQPLIIDNVDSLDDNCEIISVESLTFQVRTYDSSVCRFKYSVKPASSEFSGEASDISQLVVNDDSGYNKYLPPVSKVTKPLGKVTLDDVSLLIEAGYEIVTDSLELIGDTESGDVGSLSNISKKGFTYTAPDTQGIVRIFYTEKNVDTNDVKTGVVYIAIGQNENTSPIASDQYLGVLATVNGNKNIDVSSYIDDQDGDELQLVYASSFLGSVEINSNHSFMYNPVSTGDEIITYIVSDHNGGYGIGTLKINVLSYENIIDENQKLEFAAPYTFNDKSLFDVFSDSMSEFGATGVTGNYPIFKKDLAEAYCLTKGSRLPSVQELKSMKSKVLSDSPIFETKYKWHSGTPYLTKSDEAFSLVDGKSTVSDIGLFSCVKSILPPEWHFYSDMTKGVFNKQISVSIVSDIDDIIKQYPIYDYDLSYKIVELTKNGSVIKNPDDFIDITIEQNKVLAQPKKGFDIDGVSMQLEISDSSVSDTVLVIYGLTSCYPGIDAEKAALLGCIRSINGKNNEKFTLAIPDVIMEQLGASRDELADFKIIGTANATWHSVEWKESSLAHRQKRNNLMERVCSGLNSLKFDGRTNWSSHANNIPQEAYSEYFKLNKEDGADAKAWVKLLKIADNPYGGGNLSRYGQGYAPSYDQHYYVNQYADGYYFSTEVQGTGGNINTFMTCWSPN